MKIHKKAKQLARDIRPFGDQTDLIRGFEYGYIQCYKDIFNWLNENVCGYVDARYRGHVDSLFTEVDDVLFDDLRDNFYEEEIDAKLKSEMVQLN